MATINLGNGLHGSSYYDPTTPAPRPAPAPIATPPTYTNPLAGTQPYTPPPAAPTQPPYAGVGTTGPLNPTYNVNNPANFAPVQAPQATSAPSTYAAPPPDPHVAGLVSSYIQANGLQANQSDPKALNSITQYLRSQGINAQTDYTDANGHTGGLLIDGHPYQLIDGSNNWTSLQPWSTSGGGGGGNVFSDPATRDWETLLRQVAGQLSTPAQTPDYSSLVSYLKQYMGQLQQPGYSPAEAEQIQTASIDPLTTQRDAAVQRTIQQYAAKGLSPTSGPTQQAVADINRQFEQLRTTTQANFATQAAALTRQNAATAAQVGSGLQTLEQGQQTGNENRALQAVQLLFGIPQLADQRLTAANQTLQTGNQGATASLSTMLGLRQQAQQAGQWSAQQEQAFWASIGNLLTGITG